MGFDIGVFDTVVFDEAPIPPPLLVVAGATENVKFGSDIVTIIDKTIIRREI